MFKMFIGVIIGIVIGNIGISGTANVVDHGINKIKIVSQDASQK